jgi:hypothetical protein
MSCVNCGGLGVIEKDSKFYECQCSYIKRLASSMPVFLKKAEIQREHLSLPILNQVNRHIMVIASWPDMKAILKAVIIANPKKFVRITSDREIRDVYVGSKSRAARGDEEGKIYNSLEDLMDIADLVVVKLNELSYKNKAAPGAVEEAISYRIDRDKPTWLYSDSSKPFVQDSFAYSDSIADIIKTHFHITRIPQILSYSKLDLDSLAPLEVKSSEPQKDISEPIAASEETKTRPEPAKPRKVSVVPKIKPSEDLDASLSIYGSGIRQSNKFSRK